jgi:hypothetical protein
MQRSSFRAAGRPSGPVIGRWGPSHLILPVELQVGHVTSSPSCATCLLPNLTVVGCAWTVPDAVVRSPSSIRYRFILGQPDAYTNCCHLHSRPAHPSMRAASHTVSLVRECYLHISSINLTVSLRCCKNFIFNSALSHPGCASASAVRLSVC